MTDFNKFTISQEFVFKQTREMSFNMDRAFGFSLTVLESIK